MKDFRKELEAIVASMQRITLALDVGTSQQEVVLGNHPLVLAELLAQPGAQHVVLGYKAPSTESYYVLETASLQIDAVRFYVEVRRNPSELELKKIWRSPGAQCWQFYPEEDA